MEHPKVQPGTKNHAQDPTLVRPRQNRTGPENHKKNTLFRSTKGHTQHPSIEGRITAWHQSPESHCIDRSIGARFDIFSLSRLPEQRPRMTTRQQLRSAQSASLIMKGKTTKAKPIDIRSQANQNWSRKADTISVARQSREYFKNILWF